MFFSNYRARLSAMAIHAMISAIVFVATAAILIFLFFPSIHFQINGGWQGLRLMFAIDLILGPLLTFLIFNPLKSLREKIFDLSCVALVQLLALVYGFYTIYQQRPVLLLVYPGAVIETVTQKDYQENLSGAKLADFPLITGVPMAAYLPEHKHDNFGLVPIARQGDNIARSQQLVVKQLDERQQKKLNEIGSKGKKVYVLQLVGSFQTEWIVLDDAFAYVASLGRNPTIMPTLPQ
jgi:hypothetical protein